MRITIDIDVTNPEEVLKAHRGELVKLLTDVLLSKEKKKKRVEKAVCQEVVKVLKVDLPRSLKEELVEADVQIKIEGEDSNLDFAI